MAGLSGLLRFFRSTSLSRACNNTTSTTYFYGITRRSARRCEEEAEGTLGVRMTSSTHSPTRSLAPIRTRSAIRDHSRRIVQMASSFKFGSSVRMCLCALEVSDWIDRLEPAGRSRKFPADQWRVSCVPPSSFWMAQASSNSLVLSPRA